jgi:nucleoside-diphosphate-sugar epimerase
MTHPILVTGAADRVGGVGGLVSEALRRGLPVRAMVRCEDERAEELFTASAYRFVRLFSRNRSSLSQSRPLRSSWMPDEDASIECQRTRAR